MPNEALIIGSQRDYCYVIKEFLELRHINVSVILDYKEGIDKLFEDKPRLCVIEITSTDINPAFMAKIRNSNEFTILDFTAGNQTINKGSQVLILDDTSLINTLFDYLKSSLPEVAGVRDRAQLRDQGSLEYIFYPNLLLDIYRKERTGVLSISSQAELKINFKNGSPVFAEGGDRETMFGRLLLQSGRITPETHREVLEKTRETSKRIGEVLIEMGILSPHEINTYLELQTEERILRGFCYTSGEYSFSDSPAQDHIVEHKINLPKILKEAVKRYIYSEEIEEKNPKIKTGEKPQDELDNMELRPGELRMVQLLKNNMSVKEILDTTRIEKYEALKILYLLGLFEIIELPGVSLEQLGRKSVQRYTNENAVSAKDSEDPHMAKDRQELVELELEVYDTDEGAADRAARDAAEPQGALGQLSQESAQDIPAEASGAADFENARDRDNHNTDSNENGDIGIEHTFLKTDENVVRIFGDDNAGLEDIEGNNAAAERSPESLLADEPRDMGAGEEAQAYEISGKDKNPLSEENLLDSDGTENEPEDAREIEIPFDGENEVLNASEPGGEEPAREFEIDSEESLNESGPVKEAQDSGADLFSDPDDAAGAQLGEGAESLNDKPREISIDDSDLFSSFDDSVAVNETLMEPHTPDKLLSDEPGTDSQDALTGQGNEFAHRVLEFHEGLSDKDYYQILGVAEEADAGEIRDAYHKLVKDYHPDVNHNIHGDIKDKAREIFTTINRAYETLSDSDKRKDYDTHEQLAELEDRAKSIYEAEVEFKKGQALLSQRNYNEAIINLGEALKMNPEESAYIGAYAWASYLTSEDKDPTTQGLIEDLKKAIDLNAGIAENYYYLGSIYKNNYEMDKAEQNYEKAVEIDPGYIEAKRELRLINTRKRKNTKNKKDSKMEKRFWSSLFKK